MTAPELRSVARTVPHLVRVGGHAAILSAAAQRLLGRAQALGRRHARLSPGEHPAARGGGRDGGPGAAPAGGSRGLSGGGHLRSASGPRGIGGLDHGTEEHPLGRVLPGRHAGLPPLRPDAEDVAGTGGCVGAVRAGPVEQDDDGDAAGGAAGDLLVAAGPVVVAARRAAAASRSSCWAWWPACSRRGWNAS